jgi:hypothetical protein
MGVFREFAEGAHDRFGNGGRRQAGRLAPLTGPQEFGDAAVCAALDQLSDRVAAVQELALLTVYETDRGLGGDDALKSW